MIEHSNRCRATNHVDAGVVRVWCVIANQQHSHEHDADCQGLNDGHEEASLLRRARPTTQRVPPRISVTRDPRTADTTRVSGAPLAQVALREGLIDTLFA